MRTNQPHNKLTLGEPGPYHNGTIVRNCMCLLFTQNQSNISALSPRVVFGLVRLLPSYPAPPVYVVCSKQQRWRPLEATFKIQRLFGIS